jgi:hypothetical protein
MTSATSGSPDALSGIMIRDTMDDGPMIHVGRNPTSAYSCYIWRTNNKGATDGLNGITQTVRWLRLIRKGNQVTALHAANSSGVPGTWNQMGQPQNVFLQPSAIVGLAVSNGGGIGLNTVTYTNVSITPINKAPIVDAGIAPTTATSPLSLLGTVTDDGLPLPFTYQWSTVSSPGALSIANPAALATNATFSTLGNYTLRLTATDSLASTFDDLNFSFAGTPFEQWRTAQFANGISNPDSAPTADPDHDGLTNLVEYALGTNPGIGNDTGLASTITNTSGTKYFQLTVPKNPAATDVTTSIQLSTSLDAGSWSTSGLVVLENTSTTLTVRTSQPVDSAPRQFLRVLVTAPAP